MKITTDNDCVIQDHINESSQDHINVSFCDDDQHQYASSATLNTNCGFVDNQEPETEANRQSAKGKDDQQP